MLGVLRQTNNPLEAFSLDGTDTFVGKEQTDQYICRTLVLEGEFILVMELALLAHIVHEAHQSYDYWCYQCYWFADTIFNTIKMLVAKRSQSSLQNSCNKPPYHITECHPPLPAGDFKWSFTKVKVTEGNPQTQAVIYRRFMEALNPMNVFIAEERKKNQGVSLD